MKERLPLYVVGCFLAAGYDTAKVVSQMDSASINTIESFIVKHYPNNEEFFSSPAQGSEHTFLFSHLATGYAYAILYQK